MIFVVTSLGNFLGMFDFSSVNIALYEVSKTFMLPVSTVQWIMLSYQIVMTSLLIFFGRLSDTFDRKRLYTCGFLTFGMGATLSYFSANFSMLLIARMIQGVGGSILISNSFSIISLVFKGKDRGRALGFAGAITHLAGMTAPAISGLLMELFTWREIFLPSCIIAIIALFLSLRFVPSSYKLKKVSIDVMGTVLLAGGVASMLFMIAQLPVWGWRSVYTKSCLVSMLFCFFLFVKQENRTVFPLVSFKLFSSPAFLYSNLALFFSYFAMYPNTILFPFYSQGVLGNSAKLTGLLILPFSLFYLVTAILTGALSPHKRMYVGMLLLGTGSFLFSNTTDVTPLYLLVLMQGLMGVGNAFFQPSTNAAILNATPKEKVGMASGILSLFRNSGIATGSVVSVALFESYKNHAIIQGATEAQALLSAYHFALYAGIGFAVLCLIFIFRSASCRDNI